MNFIVITSSVKIDEVGHTTYGIEARDVKRSVLARVEDISADRRAFERLAEKCRRFELSPCRLLDVASDFIISD